jgi:hypothetical protein
MTQSLTKKQQEILTLIYKYRFLNRIQIQAFLNHKHHKRINDWLKDLTQKEYLRRIYSHKFGENTKPAIYYLAHNGIGFLKTEYNLSSEYLTKFYRNKDRSEDLINQCVLIGDIVLNFKNRGIQSKQEEHELSYLVATATDLANPYYRFHILAELKIDLVVKKQKKKRTGKRTTESFFLFQIFTPTLPRDSIRKRIKDLIGFYNQGDWEEIEDKTFPSIMIICPTLSTLIYAKRLGKRLLEEEDNPDDLHFEFTTFDQVKKHGVTGEIWEAANQLFSP